MMYALKIVPRLLTFFSPTKIDKPHPLDQYSQIVRPVDFFDIMQGSELESRNLGNSS